MKGDGESLRETVVDDFEIIEELLPKVKIS
jgi:hypothetical protein